MYINSEILNQTFIANFWDTEQEQLKQTEKLAADFVSKYKSKSTAFINQHVELNINQLESKADYFINSIFDVVGKGVLFDESLKEEAIYHLNTFFDEEIIKKKRILKAVMTSIALENEGISKTHLDLLQARCREINKQKINKLALLITKHNYASNNYK